MVANSRTRGKGRELCPMGYRIDALAADRGIGRTQLAEAAGVSYATLWSIMVGRRTPTPATAARICSALNVTPGSLLTEYRPPRSGRPRKSTLCPFGKRIESLAAHRGLDRRQLATQAGVSHAGLWSVLTGRTAPSLSTAVKLADALHVPVDRLVG